MTDSNKVLVLYMNLVPVLYQVLHGSLNFEQVQPPYICSVPGTSRYKYPVLVRTSTVQPGMYQAPYLFCTRYRVPGTSTRYWYVPLLQGQVPGTRYQLLCIKYLVPGTVTTVPSCSSRACSSTQLASNSTDIYLYPTTSQLARYSTNYSIFVLLLSLI